MPVANTRAGSLPCVAFMLSTICLIDSASPWSRAMSPGWNQLKQLDELLPLGCSGNTTAKPNRSASLPHSVCVEYTLALSVQPCIATTSGAPDGRLAGTYANIRSAPGLLPKLLTWVSVTAWLASVVSSGATQP